MKDNNNNNNDNEEIQNAWIRDSIIHLEGILPLQETMGERADIRKEIRKLKDEIKKNTTRKR